MNQSVTRLREDGTREWSLPSFDRDVGDSSDDESSEGDSSDVPCSGGDGSDDACSENAQQNALMESLPAVESGDGDDQSPLHLEPGWFVVFPMELSNPCPLEVGKIVSVDLSAADGGEVTVHWYTPARTKKCRRSKYGKGVWSPSFVVESSKRIPDQGTDSVRAACFTFPSLLQSGKLPTAVWAAVEDIVPTTSLEEVESGDEEQAQGKERERGAGGAAQTETLPLSQPRDVPRPPPLEDSRPAPPTNMRLTLAHFRQRRGQS